MFCLISLCSIFLFIMIFFPNHSNLQQIYTFGRSRYSVVLTLTKTSLFTYDQAPFFQGGRPWGAYRSRGVQIPLVRFSILFFPKSEIDDSCKFHFFDPCGSEWSTFSITAEYKGVVSCLFFFMPVLCLSGCSP